MKYRAYHPGDPDYDPDPEHEPDYDAMIEQAQERKERKAREYQERF